MPRLLLLRHAKSDWDASAGSDHERPLSRRGRRAAAIVGRVLAAAGEAPDLVISSTAVRALTTAELAIDAGEWDCELRLESKLYGASPGQVIDVARGAPAVERLCLVGHQPTFGATAAVLIGGGIIDVRTASVAAIDVSDWAQIEPDAGRLAFFFNPAFFEGWWDGD